MKESKYSIENSVIFNETFTDEQTVLRNSGNSNAGTIPVVFRNGVAIFDNSAIGLDNHISYPRTMCRFSEPEKAFSIRTKVYLTDTDGSVFAQIYNSATLDWEFRFLICGMFPNPGNNDKLSLELWDSYGTPLGFPEMRGRVYNTPLTSIALNKWCEFVCTYDGRGGVVPQDGICLYMNGVRVDDADSVDDNGGDYEFMKYDSTLSLQIGRNVEGKMEFLKTYNRVLTPSEIWNFYN